VSTAFVVLGIALTSVTLCVLTAGAFSVRYIHTILNIPAEDLEIPGKRPWWCSLVPWRGRLVASLDEIEKLKQSDLDNQTRYRILTENVAAAVIMHQPDGSILWCSPYTEVLTGYSLAEIYAERDQFLQSHVHEEEKETFKQALDIVATGEPFQYRYRFYHKSGMALWLETRTVPIFDQVTQEYVALSIALDITASVFSQQKIEERNRDLSEFTYMISHDLKAPIVTLRGMLELVRDEIAKVPSSSNTTEPLEYMSKAVGRLEQLVGGVLQLAQVSAIEQPHVPVNLGEIVGEVLDDYRLQIEKCQAAVSVVNELPPVFGNKTQLYQIFSNLVGNAIKYRSPDRVLQITIKAEPAASRRRVYVAVRDNGRGIPDQYREAIFKPFNRAGEQMAEGSGIGLACVKRLVEKLGGTIRVESVVGEGSSFLVELRTVSSQSSLHAHKELNPT
jgi:PAS domain S-box-containing protein